MTGADDQIFAAVAELYADLLSPARRDPGSQVPSSAAVATPGGPGSFSLPVPSGPPEFPLGGRDAAA